MMSRAVAFLGVAQVLRASAESGAGVFAGPFSTAGDKGTRLKTLSWNVAAVNNNPFEYWITHPDAKYKTLMEGVERFIVDPGNEDVRIDELFTDVMFQRVLASMKEVEIPGADKVVGMWESYRSRKVVSEFLRDAVIGKKRLASMPDRVTNTIQLYSGESAFRPAVINCYPGDLNSVEAWFEQWMDFFFRKSVDLDGKGPKPVYSLLQKIKKAKYPDVTEEEEALSIPLQVVLQGVFDAILVNLMNAKAAGVWQGLRRDICASLNSRKNGLLMDILQNTYKDSDAIFLQEAGNQLVDLLRKNFGSTHHVIVPKSYDAKRNQNSVMLLRSSVFSAPREVEIPVAGWDAGDLLVVVASVAGQEVTLASFHGDTNGLLTMPMLSKVMANLPTERLLFGMDANTYKEESKSTAHVLAFEKMYTELGLKACWGAVDPTRYTTFNARTYLQPQLNKAAKSTELVKKGDQNPKDFVLFTNHFVGGRVWRDNTGKGTYAEDTVFPTLEFPSDHAALAVDVLLRDVGSEEL